MGLIAISSFFGGGVTYLLISFLYFSIRLFAFFLLILVTSWDINPLMVIYVINIVQFWVVIMQHLLSWGSLHFNLTTFTTLLVIIFYWGCFPLKRLFSWLHLSSSSDRSSKSFFHIQIMSTCMSHLSDPVTPKVMEGRQWTGTSGQLLPGCCQGGC